MVCGGGVGLESDQGMKSSVVLVGDSEEERGEVKDKAKIPEHGRSIHSTSTWSTGCDMSSDIAVSSPDTGVEKVGVEFGEVTEGGEGSW